MVSFYVRNQRGVIRMKVTFLKRIALFFCVLCPLVSCGTGEQSNSTTNTTNSSISSETSTFSTQVNTTFYVYLNSNGGQCDSQVIKVKIGEPYQLPAPIRGGYTFNGWTRDDAPFESEGSSWHIEEDVFLVASWSQNVYPIEVGDGTLPDNLLASINLTYGQSYYLPSPVPNSDSMQFITWTCNGKQIPSSGTWTEPKSHPVVAGYGPVGMTFRILNESVELIKVTGYSCIVPKYIGTIPLVRLAILRSKGLVSAK